MFVNNHPHAALLQQLYASGWTREVMEDALDTSFVCHGTGRSDVGGDFVGIDGMIAHVADLVHRAEGSLQHEPMAFYADDTWGLVSARMSAKRGNRELDIVVGGFWRFSAAGHVAEHWERVTDPDQWDAFWK